MTASTLTREDGFSDTWADIFKADTLIHLCLMASVITGAIQGWLKDRLPGALPYALSDGFFILAALLWLATSAVYRRPLLRAPAGTSMDLALLAIILGPALYILAPGTPFLIEMAGLRSWSAFPVACLIAMSIVRTSGQVRAHVGLVLLVCLVTGVYGIVQYIQGPDQALNTALGQLRHGSTVFYDVLGTGTSDFRAFSTFTFPAPFAAMMVFGILLATGIALSPNRTRRHRILALLLIPVLFVAMTVTGTRAALITLLAGLLVIGTLRGFSFGQLLLVPGLLAGLHIATLVTSGKIVERYRSLLLSEGVLWLYVTNPINTAIESLGEHVFGLGLGRTGVGVPYAIASRMPRGYFVFSDGDVGRAAVELGIVGLIVLGLILVALLPRVLHAARGFIGTPQSDLALGIGGLVLSSGLIVLIGSPLSATPHAIVWWFLFGALVKLQMMQERREVREVGDVREVGEVGEVEVTKVTAPGGSMRRGSARA